MTILPSRSITAGLNVPADSHPFPRGEMIGVSELRRQTPNPGFALFCEARATNNGRTPNQTRLRIDLIMASLWGMFSAFKMEEIKDSNRGRSGLLNHNDQKAAELDPHLTAPGR